MYCLVPPSINRTEQYRPTAQFLFLRLLVDEVTGELKAEVALRVNNNEWKSILMDEDAIGKNLNKFGPHPELLEALRRLDV